MSGWRVRAEGSPTATAVAGPAEVAEGLREGVWLPTDEVRGPADAAWVPLESHPLFEETAAELEPLPEVRDDTHLDMNPLIDVCLVLLIFFILTITYESLRRTVDVPPEQAEEKGAVTVQFKDVKDQVILLSARMDGDKPVVKIQDVVVPVEELEKELKAVVARTGRTQLLIDVPGDVPWGVMTAVLDAANAEGSGIKALTRVQPKK